MPVTAVGSFQAPNIIVAGTSSLGSQDALTIYGSALNASNAFVPIIIGLNSTDVIDYEGTVTSATPGRFGSGVTQIVDPPPPTVSTTSGGSSEISCTTVVIPPANSSPPTSILDSLVVGDMPVH